MESKYVPVDIIGKELHVGDVVQSLYNGEVFVVSEIDVCHKMTWIDFPENPGHQFVAYPWMLEMLKVIE